MKKICSTILTLTLLVFALGCKPDEPVPKPPLTELEKLPLATQDGRFTFGCILNKKAWRVAEVNYPNYVTASYVKGSLSIRGQKHCAYLETNPCDDQTIIFSLQDNNPNQSLSVGKYDLTNQSVHNPSVYFSTIGYNGSLNDFCIIDSKDKPERLLSGELEITNFDKSKNIISGLFSFTLVSNCIDTINVTDGRFDTYFKLY
jgi:hypothetical protein